MDYRTLLRKYINHVSQCEGVDFTDRLNEERLCDVVFSSDEVAELLQLSLEAAQERQARIDV